MRRKRKLTPEAATGYHEAGHAVVSFFLGLSVKRVTIEPTGETLGHTKGWSRPALWANLAGVAIEPPLSRAEMAKALGRGVSEAEYAERRVLMEGAGTGKPPPRRWSTARLAHEVQREIMVL